MSDPNKLPYLLRLLEDDSTIVQGAVAREFASFGPELADELSKLKPTPTEEQIRKVGKLIESWNRQWLRDHWGSWTLLLNDKEQLEAAHTMLAEFQYGRAYPYKLPLLLDNLAEDYVRAYGEANLFRLAHYLFQVKPMRGNRDNYYDPRNSNLVFCIEEKTGAPISLCCIYTLVGYRLGLDIEGLNLPGHFLARASDSRDIYVIDCFDGGRFLSERDIAALDPPIAESVRKLSLNPPSAFTIMARVLRNLHHAYLKDCREENAMLMIDLLEQVESYVVNERRQQQN